MHWYSASAWQHHSMKHLKDNLPIFPLQFMSTSSDDVVPSITTQSLPHEEEVRKWAKAAKQFFEEEQDPSLVSTTAPPTPKMEGL